jgi:predicted RNase H-like nuclease (RuvC/YqgF family)
LADARKELDQAKKSASRVANLQKQNKDLQDQLASAKKEAAIKVAAAPAVDNSELKKLRAEADSARANAEKARKTASDLEKKNADLRKQLASTKKQTEEEKGTETEPADWRNW